MKKTFSALLLCLVLMISAFAEDNLIQNPEFEEDFYSGISNWTTQAWHSDYSEFSIEEVDGYSCLHIISTNANDARWIQTIAVEPDTVYRLSGYIRARDCSYSANARGANLCVMDTDAYTESIYDTLDDWNESAGNGEDGWADEYSVDTAWRYVEVYGITDTYQTELTVALRLGDYGRIGTGEAWFRDISFEKADDTDAAFLYDLGGYADLSYEVEFVEQTYDYDDSYSQAPTVLPDRHPLKYLAIAVIALFIFIQIYLFNHFSRKRKRRDLSEAPTSPSAKNILLEVLALVIMVLIAAVVRVYYAYSVRGYKNDIDCFVYWGNAMRESGFSFYANDGFHDYPPLYMLMLGGMDQIRVWLGIAYNSADHVLLIKLIPIICDFATGLFLYGISRKRLGAGIALMLGAFVMLNPAYIFDSAAWGQVDSVLALLLLMCVYFGVKGNWYASLPIYALALLTKPQALLFGPIGLVALIADCIQHKKQILKAAIGLASAITVMLLVSMPFAWNVGRYQQIGGIRLIWFSVKWIWVRLLDTASSYQCITINACNLYVLLDKNWATIVGNNAERMRHFAWAMFGFAYAYATIICIGGKKRRVLRENKLKPDEPKKVLTRFSRLNLPLAGTVLISIMFTFAPMMHERYLFPALALSLLAYIQHRDKRILWYFFAIMFTQFMNIALVLEWGEYSGSGNLQNSERTLNALISAINIAATLFICYTAFDISLGRKLKRVNLNALAPRAPFKGFYIVAVCAVTTIYSIVAFLNLGETNSPVTLYQSTDKNEQIVFDLGEVKTYRFTYFGGISSNYFTVALSNDGENWTEENAAQYGEGEIYKWIWYAPKTYSGGSFKDADVPISRQDGGGASVSYVSYNNSYPTQTSRYLRITAADETYYSRVATQKLVIAEVGFLDPETYEPLAIEAVYGSREGADYSALTDEQDAVAAYPSYYNGMYFDEIYHARTAYELLNGYNSDNILEWSHPHLGKLIIAIGIKIFGMTPFGWRFSGTLFGVMMLPVFYFFLKQLTGKKQLALLGMTLFALDSMHFTQTRIATVDTYAVFFILLMYLFMLKFVSLDLIRDRFYKALMYLGLSGISMGLAWASKWTGLYASAGLAIIFFIKLGLSIRDYRRLRRVPHKEDLSALPKRIMLIIDYCLIMFVCVPALIYYFSYYWHFASSGGISVQKVWALQESMYSYHSNIVDTHYFRSPWYEWPLDVWPMWYYSGDTAFIGKGVVSSISLMGNPVVWWAGILAMVVCFGILIMQKKKDLRLLLLIIGFASQYLPWVLVPRSTYIYHYFASVPFIIAAIVLALDYQYARYKTAAKVHGIVLISAAFVLFVMFYPLESGLPCRYSYAELLRWFDWYNFALQTLY